MSTESGIQESRETDSDCPRIQGVPRHFTTSLRSLEAILRDADLRNVTDVFEKVLKEGPLVGNGFRGVTRENLCLRSFPGSCPGISRCTRSSCGSTTVAGSSLSLRSVAGEESLHSQNSQATDEPCAPASSIVCHRLDTPSKDASSLKGEDVALQQGLCASNSNGLTRKDAQNEVGSYTPGQPVVSGHDEDRRPSDVDGAARTPDLQKQVDAQCVNKGGENTMSGLHVTRIQRRSPRLQRTAQRENLAKEAGCRSVDLREKKQGESPLQLKRQDTTKRPAGSSKRQSSREGRSHHGPPGDPVTNTTRHPVSIKSKRRKQECINGDSGFDNQCMEGSTTRGDTSDDLNVEGTELSPLKEKGTACSRVVSNERTPPISNIGGKPVTSFTTTKKECDGDSARPVSRCKVLAMFFLYQIMRRMYRWPFVPFWCAL